MADEDTITKHQSGQESPAPSEETDTEQTTSPGSKREAERLAERYISRAQNANKILNSRYEILESQVQRLATLEVGIIAAFVIVASSLSLTGSFDPQIETLEFTQIIFFTSLVFLMIALVQIIATTISLGGRIPVVLRQFIIPIGGPSITRNEATSGISNPTADDLLNQADRLGDFPEVKYKLRAEANKLEQTQQDVIEAKRRLRVAYTILTFLLLLMFMPTVIPFVGF